MHEERGVRYADGDGYGISIAAGWSATPNRKQTTYESVVNIVWAAQTRAAARTQRRRNIVAQQRRDVAANICAVWSYLPA